MYLERSPIWNPYLSNDPFAVGKNWILPEENKCYSFDIWEDTGQ